MNPQVCAVVLNWNGLPFIEETLHALVNQDYENFRILFVDNGSEDGSALYVKNAFPNIKIITFNDNTGFDIPNNVAMKQALSEGADYLLLINNDVIVEPNTVSELIKAGESDSRIGALGSVQIKYDDPSQVVSAGGDIDWKRCIVLHHKFRPFENQEVHFLSGAIFMVKRSVVERVGMLDEEFYFYGEDADWSTRIIKHGYKIVCVAAAFVRHHVEASSHQDIAFKIYHMTRTRLLLMRKHASLGQWLYFLPFFIRNTIFGDFIHLYHRNQKAESFAIIHAVVDYFMNRVRPLYAHPCA
jgi:GT2 family glycosyltransferase